MPTRDAALRMRPREAVERLVPIFGAIDGEVLFCTCLDEDGFVGESECLASQNQPKSTLPMEELFYLGGRTGASTMMFTSRSSGPVESLHECDVMFTERLLASGRELGIRVHDHYLVGDGTFRAISESTDLWRSADGDA